MRWITRERPKIDRVACPWLIARFIDEQPEFIFVPPNDVIDEARARDAIPFDVEGVELTHDGPRCSFDAILSKYSLERDPALERIAAIVRGADTARLDLAPEAAGLLAISLGLSAMFDDDHTQLQHGFVMYDALYAWCRYAANETHTWNPRRGRVETPLLIAFLDLSHFKHESERRDDTTIAETIDAYYAIVARAIESAEGRVVKFIGDATLAVFPERKADDGVRALLDLQPVVEQFMTERGWECRLEAKVHFGTAIAGDYGPPGDRRFDVIGRAVNHTAMLPGNPFAVSPDALERVSAATRSRLGAVDF